jgi:isocitrate lyase
VPIVADAEAGFGGNLNAFELMKGMIEAGAAGVHWEDNWLQPKNVVTWEAKYLCQHKKLSIN